MSLVATRFAPSPTGPLHIGGIRTALFNWLFSKNNNGKFYLRIEDTDKERSKEEFKKQIIDSLNWIGVNHDDKEYIQSKHINKHKEVAEKLLKNGSNDKNAKSELIAKQKYILSITENGFGKRTSFYDYRVTNRGGKGIIGINTSSRNGNVAASFPVNEGDEVILSTDKGKMIRCEVKGIRTAGRNTQGVRIFKLSGDEKVVSAIKIEENFI